MTIAMRNPRPHSENAHRTVRDLRGLWRLALAVLAPLPGLALAAQLLLAPYGVRDSFPQAMSGVATDPGRQQLAVWAGMVFQLTVLPAVFAVAWVSRRRAPWLSLIGGLLTWVGFAVGFGLPDTGSAALAAVRAALDPSQVSAVNAAVSAEPVVLFGLVVFLIGSTVGLLLLGVALWRSQRAPRWLAVALAVSGPAHVLAPGGTPGAAASWLLTGLGCFGASLALARTADDDFDLPPGTIRRPLDGAWPSRDARTFWRVLLALATPWVAIYVAVARYLLPYNMSDPTQLIFDRMVASPGFQVTIAWLGVLLAPAGVAGVVAVAWLSRRMAPVLTTIGLTLAFVGFVCLFTGNALSNLIPHALATHPGLDPTTAAALGHGLEQSAASTVNGSLFVLGHLLGTIVLGLALWRARMVPPWIALGLAVSQPIHLISVLTEIRLLDLAGWGMTALGFVAAGWALLRLSNDDFDLPPIQHENRPNADRAAAASPQGS